MPKKRYYWLRLKKDFFSSVPMKKLRKIAGGDTYTIIYLKLQLLSITTEGELYYEGIEKSLAEEMALVLDEDAENVAITINFLLSTGLMEQRNDNTFFLVEVPELIGSESDSAERVRRYREKLALQCNTDVTQRREDNIIIKKEEIYKEEKKCNITNKNPIENITLNLTDCEPPIGDFDIQYSWNNILTKLQENGYPKNKLSASNKARDIFIKMFNGALNPDGIEKTIKRALALYLNDYKKEHEDMKYIKNLNNWFEQDFEYWWNQAEEYQRKREQHGE